jgi:hypothetical protein
MEASATNTLKLRTNLADYPVTMTMKDGHQTDAARQKERPNDRFKVDELCDDTTAELKN